MINSKLSKKIYKYLINIYHNLEKAEIKFDDMLNNPKTKRSNDTPYRYIHIGYPKSASTALQKGYLGRHNQLLHLGCGNRLKKDYWDDHGYIDADINNAVEIDLRYKNNFTYDKIKTKKIFDKYFEVAQQNKHIHAIGVSNENFCFNWHGGIDVEEKAKRLFDIFEKDTRIVIVLRQQRALIESLYKENIRFGYPGTFNDFLEYMWVYKDRNFTHELNFLNIIKVYTNYFGEDNIKILFFEDLKKSSKRFLENFSKAIGIDYYNLNLSKNYNEQLSLKELKIKRILNNKYPHTFGKAKYDIVDNHRYVPYYTDEIGIDLPLEIHFDYQVRHHFNALSKVLSSKIEMDDIKMSWNSKFGEKLIDFYKSSNTDLLSVMPALKEKFQNFKYINN